MLVAFSTGLVFVCRRIVSNQPVKLANDFKRIARSEAEGELESFGLVYVLPMQLGATLQSHPRWKCFHSPADFLVW